MKRNILFFCLLTFCNLSLIAQLTISGSIESEGGENLENVVVTMVGGSEYALSNENGFYSIELSNAYQNQSIRLVYSLLGYVTQVKELTLSESQVLQNVVLKSKSLKIEEVKVVALSVDDGVSNSSIAIDQDAIEITQANSLRDVFSLLPGQEVVNSDLQGAQTIALRTTNTINTGQNVGSEQKNMASFGTAIIIDGINQSNNAALETTGSISGGRNITLPGGSGNATSVANGLDLRTIATENIESIEVVAGVASAKYGDFSDGAVIVKRKAGVAPWRANIRNNPGLINSSISKGFDLQKNGIVNASIAYLYDNSDPTEDLKSFSRLTGSAIWSVSPTRKWKNTLNINYSTNLDESKTDPEINPFARGEYQSRSFALSNRGNVNLKNKWNQNINYNVGYRVSNNDIFETNRFNRPSFWTTDNLERGRSEGFLVQYPIQPSYTVNSRPIQFTANIGNEMSFATGNVLHRFSQGFQYTLNNNTGDGTSYNLREPYFSNAPSLYEFSVAKPDTFERRNLKQSIIGGYLEDKFSINAFSKEIDFSLGVRGDHVNEAFTISPRLSSQININKQFRLGLAYGRNAKSAPLAYIAPNRGFYEFPLIDTPFFRPTTPSSEQITYYPVFTEIIDTTFSSIKPMVSDVYELSSKVALESMNITTNVFYKDTKDGFLLANEVFQRVFPIETVTGVQDGSVITAPLRDSIYFDDFNRPLNGLTTKTRGIELLVNTDKIRSISTSFDLNSALTWGEYNSTVTEDFIPVNFFEQQTSQGIYIGRRPTGRIANDFSARSALTTITHIPRVGLVATLRTEAFWYSRTENNTTALLPVGYYDENLNFFEIPEENRRDEVFAPFREDNSDVPIDETESFYNFHLKLSKEISDYAKLSFYANNFLNYRPLVSNINGTRVNRANQEPQFGGELIITFNQ